MAHILGKAFLAQWLELRSYNPQGPRGMGLNLRHDIQDPGWQWSGARELPERDGDEDLSTQEIIFFAEEVAHEQNLLSSENQNVCIVLEGCLTLCRTAPFWVRPVNVPLHGTRAGCKDSSSRCRCEVPRAFESSTASPWQKEVESDPSQTEVAGKKQKDSCQMFCCRKGIFVGFCYVIEDECWPQGTRCNDRQTCWLLSDLASLSWRCCEMDLSRRVTLIPLLDTMAATEAAHAVSGEWRSIGFKFKCESMAIIGLGSAQWPLGRRSRIFS